MATSNKFIERSGSWKILGVALCALCFLTSCQVLGKDGLIIMTDRSYKATVFMTNKAGIGAPDGLRWFNGKLYLADEGPAALQALPRAGGSTPPSDGQFGRRSPQGLVIQPAGNVF